MRRYSPIPFRQSRILIAGAALLLSSFAVKGQGLVLQDPTAAAFPATSQDVIKMAFTVNGGDPKVRVGVAATTAAGAGPLIDAVMSKELSPLSSAGAVRNYSVSVNLFEGYNTITVVGFNAGAATSLQSWNIRCTGQWCSKQFSLTPDSVVSVLVPGAALPGPGGLAAVPAPGIAIQTPAPNATFQDETFIPVDIQVKPAAVGTVTKVFVRVLNRGKPVTQPQNSYPVEKNEDGTTAKLIKARIRIAPGTNEITAFDADAGVASADKHTIVVTCAGEKCGTESDVATIITNSQNTRVIVGMEQVGASSTSSETKPFLDFFFTTPLAYSGKGIKAPRLASWGQIRLASTPDQITATGIFPTNLVNQVGQSGTAGSLVQSFDFLAGLEARLFTANGSFPSLIPGLRQKTRFYIAGGGGAISPLTAKRENAQIFKIPQTGDPQYDLFVDRYGTPPAGKEFVAFVPLDRDRFLRQWYAGLRLKTYYCEDQDCTRFRNSFPGIVDVMFGQNEAVTGGSRKYGGFPDPNDNTKIIGEKNAYVLRIDGFYPLPFRAASFLYLYGTAMMKIGGGRVKVVNPLFLDPATTLITDPKVFIPPAELQQLLQPNRDYYKIGVGINLTDLFNRSRTPPQ